MKLPVIEFPSSMFTWTNGGQSACCEASDLGNRHLQYLDPYNRGFIIDDLDENRKITFCVTATEMDGEGEITHWNYRSSEGMTATIFND